MDKWQQLEAKYLMQTVRRCPITLVRGEGMWVWDETGKKYLDFVGGWAVNSLGHCHPTVVKAIVDQAGRLIQSSNQFYTIPQVQLAELLITNSCLDRVFFCNSGAEANEGASKLARRYGKLHLKGAYEIITTHSSFHGRTLAMVAATGQHKFQDPYIPLPDGFVNVEYDSVAAIESAITANTCAVMLEPIQGEGGVNVPADDYLKKVRALCDSKGIILILDEVQTGIGRIGSLFGYQQYGVEPDIMTLAKGLGSGVPIGALMAKQRAAVFAPGEHGSTFGGNPLVCAAAVATIKYIIENDIPGRVNRTGLHLVRQLEKIKQDFDFVTQIRGRGLLQALEFSTPMAEWVNNECVSRGLLVNTVKPNALRFIPPLIVSEAEIDSGINILREVLRKWQTEKR